MTYKLRIHPEVLKRDLARIDKPVKVRLRKAIETKILAEPLVYTLPLRNHLAGGRKLQLGPYRILFRIFEDEIRIYRIGHRSEIYKEAPVERVW